MWIVVARRLVGMLARFAILQAEAEARGLGDAPVFHLVLHGCPVAIWADSAQRYAWAAARMDDDADRCGLRNNEIACVAAALTAEPGMVDPARLRLCAE